MENVWKRNAGGCMHWTIVYRRRKKPLVCRVPSYRYGPAQACSEHTKRVFENGSPFVNVKTSGHPKFTEIQSGKIVLDK